MLNVLFVDIETEKLGGKYPYHYKKVLHWFLSKNDDYHVVFIPEDMQNPTVEDVSVHIIPKKDILTVLVTLS